MAHIYIYIYMSYYIYTVYVYIYTHCAYIYIYIYTQCIYIYNYIYICLKPSADIYLPLFWPPFSPVGVVRRPRTRKWRRRPKRRSTGWNSPQPRPREAPENVIGFGVGCWLMNMMFNRWLLMIISINTNSE